ncbi:hypothetical protein BARBAKC583_0562 [Bartonella bacilliformis KC583]|uniref:Uncharacterized protein n=1 Tax=Bartonella bacilliformis (strain ATCC 35685 / KC583 / Herrer 020/F12,63) TaxID=360095 RepID=A1USC0_BARBK|nr:hypothetical protein BARBAKC583_0562 [Bartonella bacilliformis KC583]
MVEQQPSKLNMRVRFPLPAPDIWGLSKIVVEFFSIVNEADFFRLLV